MNQTGRYAHLRINKEILQLSKDQEEKRQTNEFVNEIYQDDFADQISNRSNPNLKETRF